MQGPWARVLVPGLLTASVLLGLSLGFRGNGLFRTMLATTILLSLPYLIANIRRPDVWLGPVFLALVILSQLIAGVPLSGISVTTLACFVAFPAVVAAARSHPYGGWVVLGGVVAGVFGSGLLTLAQSLIGGDESMPLAVSSAGDRFAPATGSFPHWTSNGVALSMAALALMALLPSVRTLFEVRARIWTMSVVLILLLLVVASVLSQSRTAVIAAAVGFALWAIFLVRGKAPARGFLIPAAVSILALVGGIAVMYSQTPDRVASLFQANDPRIPLWKASVSLIIDHPLLGLGGSGRWPATIGERWQTLYGVPTPERFIHPHNAFLGVAVFYGLPALVAAVAWMTCLIRTVWSSRFAPIGVGLLAMYLIGSTFDATCFHLRINETAMLLLAATAVIAVRPEPTSVGLPR